MYPFTFQRIYYINLYTCNASKFKYVFQFRWVFGHIAFLLSEVKTLPKDIMMKMRKISVLSKLNWLNQTQFQVVGFEVSWVEKKRDWIETEKALVASEMLDLKCKLALIQFWVWMENSILHLFYHFRRDQATQIRNTSNTYQHRTNNYEYIAAKQYIDTVD